MYPLATIDDLETVWGVFPPEEYPRIDAWLLTASNKLRLIGKARGIDVDLFISENHLFAQAARDAVVEAVRRRLLNPEGLRQTSVTMVAGPYNETKSHTIDSTLSSGGIVFLPEDLTWLPVPRRKRIAPFSIRSGFRS